TNQGLIALAFTIHMSLLGRRGFAEMARLNLAKAEYAKRQIAALRGFELAFTGPTFNEFTVRVRGGDARNAAERLAEKYIFPGVPLRPVAVPAADADALFGALASDKLPHLPEVSEVEVTRHYTRLSRWNYAIDIGLYPLGSCTMKYNPKVNERAARMPGFAGVHPAQPESSMEGALELMWRLERVLCELGGFERVTLQPSAGAQGELAGVRMIRAWRAS